MYDVIFEAATYLAPELRPARPSFTRMIYPLFARLVQNQWVNAGFLRDFGWGSPSDFLAPDTLRLLASPAPEQAPLRRQIFERFRNPSYTSMEYDDLPPYYGDGVDLPATNPRQWMAVLPIQYAWLLQWANGDFDADWPAGRPDVPGNDRRPAAGGATGGPRPRGPRRVPRRSIPSRLRDDLADAADAALRGAIPAAAAVAIPSPIGVRR